MSKRPVDLVVISDVHLGTYGCHAVELNRYLKSIKPRILILNGDIMDMWQFKKYYWPDSHMKVLKTIMALLSKGTVVYYLTGNHDENLRKFSDFRLSNFHLRDKLLIELNGKTAWFFHGDVFDVTMKYSKTVAKLGGVGYDLLILLNRMVNFVSCKLGRGKMSFSKSIKDGVKSAVKFINDFENTATDLAIDNGYEYVVCGHIHRPVIKRSVNGKGSVTYLNSGDWVENLTSLEYNNGEWMLYRYDEKQLPEDIDPAPEIRKDDYFEMNHEIFEHIISQHEDTLRRSGYR
ncbi:MAG: UDP-2,3-diacylglucosamine diphosphatase [Cyclonatronaceae bacterium]